MKRQIQHLSYTDIVNSSKKRSTNVFTKIWRTLIGTPVASAHELEHRVDKKRALALFSSDALSSVAYGPEQTILVLMAAGTAAMVWGIPITIAIAVLVIIVAISYRQTIHAYPGGGGSFIVANENLGVVAGLTAASALLIDYILTVAVSVTAGISAIVSVFPEFSEFRILFGIVCIGLLVLANLRGLKDSGTIFALPTYIFIVSVLLTIGVGFIRMLLLGQHLQIQNIHPTMSPAEPFSLWLILRAFSSGASTLTGIEAVSNGVPSFKPSESKNAAKTLSLMAGLLAVMALGIAFLAYFLHAVPSDTETVLSQIGRTVFGTVAFPYFILQISTTLILLIAANTAFADFPRLSSILAQHKFMPHQMAFRGDKLAFFNGILILGVLSSILLVVFEGNERYLIPLYAIGVFLAFTLSQTGMVYRWWKLRTPGWKMSMSANLLGAITTFIVLIIITVTKFSEGAWAIIFIIPLLAFIMHEIYKHYSKVEEQLFISDYKPKTYHSKFIIPLSKIDKHSFKALDYARSITAKENIIPVHVTENVKQPKTIEFEKRWKKLVPDIQLVVLESPYRTLIQPLVTFLDSMSEKYGEPITVVISDYQPVHWWEHILHTHISLRLKAALLNKPGIIIINTHFRIHK